MDLLPLDEARRRLRIVGQSYLGVRPIPVDRIIGSLDRSTDFDRDFRPRRDASRARLASLRRAFADGPMPPIEVHECGGAYFVADGHHRVALARERGAEFIDADVTRLQTNYEVGPDVDVRQLVHTEQQRVFLDASGLGRARPDAVIEFSRPGGYPELLEIVKAHGYDMAARLGRVPPSEEVAADWFDRVYLPGVLALRREALPEVYESRPTRICSSGSISAGAHCASRTKAQTSRTPPGAPGACASAAASGVRSCARRAARFAGGPDDRSHVVCDRPAGALSPRAAVSALSDLPGRRVRRRRRGRR